MAIDTSRINWEKQGLEIKTNSRQQVRKNGNKPVEFYGTHKFKEGDLSVLKTVNCFDFPVLKTVNGFDFPVIGELSAEKLLNLGVADIVFNDDKTKYLYYITRDCKVKVSCGGVVEYVRKGVIEPRYITNYELIY
jgi:hypothetical protein